MERKHLNKSIAKASNNAAPKHVSNEVNAAANVSANITTKKSQHNDNNSAQVSGALIILLVALPIMTWFGVRWFKENLYHREYLKQETEWNETMKKETSKPYWIDINGNIKDNVINAPCSLTVEHRDGGSYNGQKDMLKCTPVKVSGQFSKYDTGGVSGEGLKIIGDKFTYMANARGLTSADWDFDAINGEQLAKMNIYNKKTLSIKNTKLFNSDMVKRTVEVKYILTNSDMDLIRSYHDKYKAWRAAVDKELFDNNEKKKAEEQAKRDEEARKAQEAENARKVEEARKAQEAENARRAEEAKKAEEARKAQEAENARRAEEQRRQQQTVSQPTAPTVSNPPVQRPSYQENNAVYYKNCTEARRAGAAPILAGQPGYRKALDRDGDGVACDR